MDNMKKTMLATALAFTLIIATVSPSCAAGPDGVALYRAICAKCHNSLENTTIPSRNLKRIKSAIRQNLGGMWGLKNLNDKQLKAVADVLYLAGLPEEKADGTRIYGILCSNCHNRIDRSDIKNKTSADIRLAIIVNKCGNPSPKRILNDSEVEKVAAALKAEQGL